MYERMNSDISCGLCGDKATWKKKYHPESEEDISSENDDNFVCDNCLELIEEGE
jgi:hypothetical protein